MSSTRHPVVVGVDGSPSSLEALAWAVGEARMRALNLRVVCAYGWPLMRLPLPSELLMGHESNREAAEHVARSAAGRARELAPGLTIDIDVSPMLPAAALIEASRDAAVLVLGTRGRGGFAELLVGSVGTQVAAHALGPVVIVRTPAAIDGPVVVGVDGSGISTAALAYAFDQAAWRGVGLVAVHAWTWPTPDEPEELMPTVRQALNVGADAARLLAEAVAGWSDKYPDVPVEHRVVRGRPGPVIVAESKKAQLVVVGSRRRGDVAALVLGSVSHHVLHRSRCPVAIVPPH